MNVRVEGVLGDSLVERLGERGDRTAVAEADSGRVLSYGDLADAVSVAADRWRARAPAGATVALSGVNGAAWLQELLGAVTAGLVVATVSPLGVAGEIAQQLRRCEATHLVADPSVASRLDGALDPDVVLEVLGEGKPAEVVEQTPAPGFRADDVIVLMTSSGTTGRPKTAQLTRRGMEVSARQLALAWGLRAHDVVLGLLPFSHAAGLTNALTALTAGVPLVTLPGFELTGFLRALQDQRVSVAMLAPPILRALGAHPAVDGYDLTALRVIASAGAPLPAEVHLACEGRLGAAVCNSYGMTEIGWIAMGSVTGPSLPGTVGHVLPQVELRVVDPVSGADVEPGAAGELWVRGPAVTPGYLHDLDATTALITADGWARTGDLGTEDDTGAVRIVDRLKDLIKYKGHQVAPAELEQMLLTRDDIADVAVAADTEPDAGEIPHAYIVARQSIDPDELMAWVAKRVSPHKRVRAVTFVEEIPRLPAGKILRRLLTPAPNSAG